MKTMKILRMMVRGSIPALALAAAAGVMLPSCEKEPIAQKPVYRAPYEKTLPFNQREQDSVEISVVKHFVDDTACKKIYLYVTPDNNFLRYSTQAISVMRGYFQERIDLSPDRVSGLGDFVFGSGVCSKPDSIWYVQNGWTINKR